jgi:hypothetical protein
MVYVSNDIVRVSYSNGGQFCKCPEKQGLSRPRGECRTMAALFHGEGTRALLLRVAADYDCMADRAAMFELQDADREAGIIPPGTVAQALTR